LEDQRGNLRAAERWYSQAAKLKPTTLTLVFLGGVLAKQGRYRDSKRCHRRAIRLATHNPDEAYLNLGLILRAERKYERAIECFERAIQLDPKYETAKIARRDIREVLKLKRQLKKL
jgi:tetratricopeptide (TPR) repeat protein